MPATAVLRQRSRTLVIAAAVPLALAALADDVRVRRQLHDARHDPLSGLPGRADLLAHTGRLLNTANRDSVHLIMLDGNGFKAVNDTYGHATGDAVIHAMGTRLARWTQGRPALAARLGGDEFGAVAVLPNRSALAVIAALRDQMQQPVHHDGHTLGLTASFGIARAADLPGESADRLLRGADAAMYRVKQGHAAFPCLASVADAYASTVNGRRAGRPGAHLPLA
ncbi:MULTISPECIES: GGDEF domain-containing protein [unclassified Streptomyces]|uniref:GGDEF domain-containing protein n=1 Tax=unclassified Streptomyces TaxID=2593676 RepID=UPI0035DC377B